jgi:hypothetical protein
VRLVLQITKGILRDQHSRRMTMFVVVIAALLMLFIGSTLLNGLLLERPLLFVGFWLVCAWLTLCAVLLAIYDLLMLRARARDERRRLRRQVFGNSDEER